MKRIAPPLVSFGLCILVITLFLAVSTPSPLDTLGRFFSGTFSSWWYLGNMLNTAVLLIPAAIGSAVALRSGSLNLGGEAQLYAPALV
ncbi:MAG: ABC transporter permease, partial [Treponema sp.]|nr:ABC transporter permease [Treponema sp.]